MIQLLKHRLSIHLNISLLAGPALSCPLPCAAAASPCSEVPDSDHPKTLLSGDPFDAFAFLPDIHSGYYRSSRLDRSGVVKRPLKNMRKLSIAAAGYSRNFLIFDGQPTSPGMTIRFPFKQVSEAPLGDPVEIKGRHITYKEELKPRQRVADIARDIPPAHLNQIITEETKSKAGISRVPIHRYLASICGHQEPPSLPRPASS